MKTSSFGVLLFSLLVTSAVVEQHSYAQSRPLRAGRNEGRPSDDSSLDVVRIRKLTGLNREGALKTPEYTQSSSLSSVKRPQDWVEVKLTYDTKPAWIDEVAIQFFVLTEYEVKGKFFYILSRKTVRNADVEQGKDHLAAVYLPPNTVKRYGYPVAIAVEVSVDGKVVAALSQQGERRLKLPDDWWKNDKVVKAEGVSVRDDALLSRDRTPFAMAVIDDYEVVK